VTDKDQHRPHPIPQITTSELMKPMNTEPQTAEPQYPVYQLTTSELTRYRRELEHAVTGISPGAPVQAELRRRLDVVLAEQDEREKMAGRGGK
jgi:hypothetical protein